MKKQAFTLTEILIVLVIIGILATLGYPVYQNTKQDALMRIDAVHLKALKGALDIYIMEYDKVPASISEIPHHSIHKSYANLLKEKGAWKIKLAYRFLALSEIGFAYATEEPLFRDVLAKGSLQLLISPGDKRADGCRNGADSDTSYGIWQSILNHPTGAAAWYNNPLNVPPAQTVLADSTSIAFTTLSTVDAWFPHYNALGSIDYYYNVRINKAGIVQKCHGTSCQNVN